MAPTASPSRQPREICFSAWPIHETRQAKPLSSEKREYYEKIDSSNHNVDAVAGLGAKLLDGMIRHWRGGATANGGRYSVASTIGQAAAGGPATGGPYDMNAGFLEIPGGPELTIQFTATDTIVLFWPVPALGCFALQETASLSASPWEDLANPVTFAYGVDHVTVTLTGKTQYYRLISPCQ
jgi:hypothetical protein